LIQYFKNIYAENKRLKKDTLLLNEKDSLFYNFKEHKIIFIHIPKTAGVSIIKSLFNDKVKTGGHRNYIYLSKLFQDFNDYFKFTIVRNPWDRLFSAYNFLSNGGINIHDKNAFNMYLKNTLSFEDFVLNWINEENIFKIIHFYPQYWFLKNRSGKINIDHIGYYEQLESSFKLLCDKFNFKNKLKHLNKNNMSLSYKDVYNDEMIEKVRLIYNLDIKLFKYSFDGN